MVGRGWQQRQLGLAMAWLIIRVKDESMKSGILSALTVTLIGWDAGEGAVQRVPSRNPFP